MSGRQFDRVARQLATTTDRRNVVRGALGAGLGALLLRFGLDPQSAAGSTTAGIAEAINNYRVSQGLPAIPVSVELTQVAKTHVNDLLTYQPDVTCGEGGARSLHSWSHNGTWTGGCYTASNAELMWDKPREITSYSGDGYEISAWRSPSINADQALDQWQGSPGHNDVILNQGIWADLTWGAIGGWAEGQHACAWFGVQPGTPPVTSNPPGTQNPTFSGSKVTIVNSASTPNTGTSKNVHDGTTWTNWAVQGTPSSASLRLDLGGTKAISGVKWKFSSLGYADSFHVRLVSASGTVLKTYGPYGNGTATQTWFGVAESGSVNARYVHFVFTNPNNDSAVGAIGEVEVWQKPTGSPGTQDPRFSSGSTKATIINSASTPNTGTAGYAHDGNTGTNWHSGHVYPGSASLRLDLGANKPITGVKWKFAALGFADSFRVRLVTAGGSTREYGPFSNATAAQTFFGVAMSPAVTARYVHLVFANPSNDSAVGSVSEVEIWVQGGTSYPPGTQNPAPQGALIDIVNSASTPNTGTSRSAHDGNVWSNWAVQGSPSSASLRFDLGGDYDVTDVTWAFSSLGYADKFSVRLVNASGQVTATYGPFGNATVARTYFGVYINTPNQTRYVHFIFENPNRDVAVGAVGEVRVYGSALGAMSYDGLQSASETDFAGEVVPADQSADGAFQASGSSRGPQPPRPVTYDIGEAQELTGVRWQTDREAVVAVAWSADGVTWTETGLYASLALPGQWQGTGDVAGIEARQVRLTWHPVTANEPPAIASVVEIWGLGEEPIPATPELQDGTPEPAQPEATPQPDEPTAEATETAEPTEEVLPTEQPAATPLAVVDTGDTEDSGTAWNAQDDDPGTFWSVSPSQSPQQVRLYIDLGQVQPIDRLTFTLRTWDQLPVFEVWLSVDAGTWYNATPGGISGWNLPRDEEIAIQLGYDARFVRIVVPDVDRSGLGQIGGIDNLRIWGGDSAQTLASSLAPTTPTPEPVTPTVEPSPTEEPTAEPTIEETIQPTNVPTDEPTAEPTDVPPPTEEPTAEPLPTEEPTTEPTEAPPAEEPTAEAVG